MSRALNSVPRHVGIIMDGNGRWAKKRLMPRSYGHNAGMKAMSKISERAAERGIEDLTVYALSTENIISRPADELEGLYNLLRKYFGENAQKLCAEGSAIKIIGDLSALPPDVEELLKKGEANSPENARFTLVFAINYGSRSEIARAANLAAAKGGITEESLENELYTAGIPAPDLIIRTGGEMRLSNFLLYQAAYAELYFTKVLFPDFTPAHFDKAIEEYMSRERRYGGSR